MHKMLRMNIIGTGLTLMLGLAACGEGTSVGTTGQDPMTSMQPPNACPETIETPKGDPNATYIPMGMAGVNFGKTEVTGSPNEPVEIIGVDIEVTSNVVQQQSVAVPNAFVNYRLMTGDRITGSAQNLNPAAGPTSTITWASFATPLTIPQNGTLTLHPAADTNTWANIAPTGWHTNLYNIGATARITQVKVRGTMTGTVTTASISSPVGPKSYQLLRNVFAIGAAAKVPNGYSTQVITPDTIASGFTVAGYPSEDGSASTLTTLMFNWYASGVKRIEGNNADLPYTIYATDLENPCTSTIVATGRIPYLLSGNSSYAGSASIQLAPPGSERTAGVGLSVTKPRIFTIAFNMAYAFTAIPNATASISASLTGCTFNDGTHGLTTPKQCDPALFVAPIVGHAVTN